MVANTVEQSVNAGISLGRVIGLRTKAGLIVRPRGMSGHEGSGARATPRCLPAGSLFDPRGAGKGSVTRQSRTRVEHALYGSALGGDGASGDGKRGAQ